MYVYICRIGGGFFAGVCALVPRVSILQTLPTLPRGARIALERLRGVSEEFRIGAWERARVPTLVGPSRG
jgi:hypothetical protein